MLAENFVRLNENSLASSSTTSVQTVNLNKNESVEELNKLKESLETKFNNLETSLKEKFKTLNDLIEERKQLLLAELSKSYRECQNLIEVCLVNLKNKEIHSESKSSDLIFFKISNSLDELAKWVGNNALNNDDNTILSYFENLNALIRSYGNPDNPKDNSKLSTSMIDCTIKGNGINECVVNEESSFILEFKNKNSSIFSKSSVSFLDIFILTCDDEISNEENNEFKDPSNPNILESIKQHYRTNYKPNCNLQFMSDGLYVIKYKLEKEGIYKLHILIDKKHVCQSPYILKCKNKNIYNNRKLGKSLGVLDCSVSSLNSLYNLSEQSENIDSKKQNFLKENPEKVNDLLKIGSHGRGIREFLNPQSVCLGTELIYITDSSNQKIEAFNYNGDYQMSLGHNARPGDRVIRRPIGIAQTKIDDSEKILASDYENKCINVFEANTGRFLSKICQNKLIGPKGICINNHGQLIIADAKGNSIFIYDLRGKLLKKFGTLGKKNENFSGPQYVCCMSNDDIIISDFYNHCIKVFDLNGQFKLCFGSNGTKEGQFNGPTGLAVDNLDNIISVDWGNSRVQVFNKHGEFLKVIETDSSPLYGPQDIAIKENKLAVVDSGNHCVKFFDYF